MKFPEKSQVTRLIIIVTKNIFIVIQSFDWFDVIFLGFIGLNSVTCYGAVSSAKGFYVYQPLGN